MLVSPGAARTVERRPRGAGTRGSPGIRERTSGALDRRGSLARGLRSGQAGEGARHHSAGCRPGDRSLRPASWRRPGDSRHGPRTFDDDGQLIPSCSVHRVAAGQSGPGSDPDCGSRRDRYSCVPTRRLPRRPGGAPSRRDRPRGPWSGDCRSPDPQLDRNAEPPRRRCVNRRAKGHSAEYANNRTLCADVDRGAAGEAGHSCFPSRSLRAAGNHFATSPAAMATGMAGLHCGRARLRMPCLQMDVPALARRDECPSLETALCPPGFRPLGVVPLFQGRSSHRVASSMQGTESSSLDLYVSKSSVVANSRPPDRSRLPAGALIRPGICRLAPTLLAASKNGSHGPRRAS